MFCQDMEVSRLGPGDRCHLRYDFEESGQQESPAFSSSEKAGNRTRLRFLLRRKRVTGVTCIFFFEESGQQESPVFSPSEKAGNGVACIFSFGESG